MICVVGIACLPYNGNSIVRGKADFMKDRVIRDVIINKAASEKVAHFFPWVYDNEILRCTQDVEKGELVRVCSPSGAFLGIGYINLKSTIAVRILSFVEHPIDDAFLRGKISKAWERRQSLMRQTNACRLVHSEADDLSGFIADYYNGYLSIQINTAGMENLRRGIISALTEVMEPRGIYERSDARSRAKEGLDATEGVVFGEVPDEIVVEEKGVRFCIRMRESQKTGFYLDQRRNREIIASCVGEGFRVLDVFSNTGGFGIHAALKGADTVTLVDTSSPALDLAAVNARLNGLKNVAAVKADAFDYLDGAFKKGKRYDLIVLDPPSFTKTKSSRGGALKGYRRLMLSSLRLLRAEGYLALFSCSHHVSLEDLMRISLEAAEETDSRLEVVEHLFQDRDHPYVISIPQSFYLKGVLFRKSLP
jgi:23S rRNA (cytosine1962-C5)-methyltransferase